MVSIDTISYLYRNSGWKVFRIKFQTEKNLFREEIYAKII